MLSLFILGLGKNVNKRYCRFFKGRALLWTGYEPRLPGSGESNLSTICATTTALKLTRNRDRVPLRPCPSKTKIASFLDLKVVCCCQKYWTFLKKVPATLWMEKVIKKVYDKILALKKDFSSWEKCLLHPSIVSYSKFLKDIHAYLWCKICVWWHKSNQAAPKPVLVVSNACYLYARRSQAQYFNHCSFAACIDDLRNVTWSSG